ncbi:MAG: response regulator [Lachnospiraceae bacterium]|nr:response regulator [Lachnospiraceae bacterium]
METVYIADDEVAIREGLKCILDWEELGFTVCGEAGNGEDALKDILALNPTLTLIDMRMPSMYGNEVIEKAKAQGYRGTFVILSGYSDFKYAQSAMKCGVKYYLTKPMDEEELEQVVREVYASVQEQKQKDEDHDFFRRKSKREILLDIVTGKVDFGRLNVKELELEADIYQVVLYENFRMEEHEIPYQFADMFQVADGGHRSFEHFVVKDKNVLLLKGQFAIEKFGRFLKHYDAAPQKGSPLDTLFISYGAPVKEIRELKESYDQAAVLMNRRFFCAQGQHVLGFADLPTEKETAEALDKTRAEYYATALVDYLQTFNRRKVTELLATLEERLYHLDTNTTEAKVFLTDLFLRLKEAMNRKYTSVELPLASNQEAIAFINEQNYLYEIVNYFAMQFEQVMNALGNSSRDSVLDDILHYIEHNYHTNIKLESIAALFGYNSSYLGKIFHKTVGESFNSYVDQVRVKHAIALLKENRYKVYEVAERVGYKNVDYFHKKFKKYVGESPAEYRKKLGMTDAE